MSSNLRVDRILPSTGTEVGVGTATGSVALYGDVNIAGTLTYEDVTNIDSVGIVTAQSGIHVTSGQVLVAKTTTSITTQGSRLDNGLITVSGNSSSTNLATNNGGNLSLANIDSTDNNFSNIGGYNSNGLVVSQIDFINKSHSSRTGDIAFLTHNGSAMSERLRITSDGNIGVGDNTPDNTLSIKGLGSFDADSNSFYFGSNFTGTGQNYIGSSKHAQRFFLNNASANGYFSYSNTGSAGTAGDAITWQERLRIDSNGNLGVNKTPETDWSSSYRAIEIGNSSVSAYQGGTYPSIELNMNCRGTQGSYSAGWKYILGMRATQIHMPYSGEIRFRRANSGSAGGAISWNESMRITSDGKTGIGGLTPQNLLNVNASGSMGLYGTIAGKVGHSIRFMRKYGSSSTHTFATINGASPQGQSRLAGFVATYTFRSAYGFDSAGGGHGVRMLSGRVRDSGEWDFDTETDFGTGDSPRPALQGVDNSDGTCNLQVVNPSSTHSYGEFHIVAWDCVITSPST